jgi:hypothetical protein
LHLARAAGRGYPQAAYFSCSLNKIGGAMGALEKYLQQVPDTFDISNLLDADVEEIESAVYSAPLIYKYFPQSRRSFFERPQVRFSQRMALNDPFEMSVRWKQISTDGLRTYINSRLEQTLPRVLSNTELLIEMVRENFTENGR